MYGQSDSGKETLTMKNRLFTLAGALALIAVLGKFYAVPALAQVRAALVKNIDEKGRIPYQAIATCPTPVAGISCAAAFPAVPVNRRLVIQHINAEFNKVAGFEPTAAISFIGDDNLNRRFVIPTFARVGTTNYGINSPLLAYVEAGRVVSLEAFGSISQAQLTGYLVDLTQ